MGSHHHLRASNVEGVDCVPSPLSQALHQNGAGKALQQQASDGLKARNTYVALSLLSHDLVPWSNTVGVAPTWESEQGLQNDEIEH